MKFYSFSKRLTRKIILVVLTILGILAIVTFSIAMKVMIEETEKRFFSILHISQEKIEKRFVEYVVASRNVRDEIQRHLDSPEKVIATMKEELALNPNILGYGVGFVPDYYKDQGRWFEPYVTHRHDSIKVSQIGSAQKDYLGEEWYKVGIESDDGIFVDPYDDNVGAMGRVVTYVLPVRDKQGRKIGVMGADILLDELQKMVYEIEKNYTNRQSSSYEGKDLEYETFIIDSKGRYFVHWDERRIMNGNFADEVAQTPDKADDRVYKDMKEKKKGLATIVIEGKKSLLIYFNIDYTNWSMGMVIPMRVLYKPGTILGLIIIGLILIGLQAIYLLCRASIRKSTEPLHSLAESADEVAKGNFKVPLPDIQYNDEIKMLRDSFDNMQHSLASYVEQLKTTTAEKASMEREINIASKIQMAMLPTSFPDRHDVSIYGSLKPAKTVGGDLFDFFFRDGKLFFCVGDVLGKGVSAAMLMTVTKSLFRAYSVKSDRPEDIISHINQIMSTNSVDLFVTLFVGVLDLQCGRLVYCSAGHESPVLISDRIEELPFLPAFPVGSFYESIYKPLETTLKPYDILFLFTDGLNEAMDANRQMFTRARIYEVAHKAKAEGTLSPESLIVQMQETVDAFVAGAEQSDDMTMLAIQRMSPTNMTLKVSKKSYPKMTGFIKSLAANAHLNEDDAGRLRLAVEEAVGNIIDYSGATEIKIDTQDSDGLLTVTISDDGEPFDPTVAPGPDLSIPVGERPIGGLGIMFMRRMSNSLTYHREANRNILEIKIKY